MAVLGSILSVVGVLVMLVCYILVLIKMFQNGKTGLGIVCIVLTLCCVGGPLIAYIYGWMKSGQWNIRNVMIAWTVGIILWVVGVGINPEPYQQQFKQIEQQQQLPGR